MTGPLLSTLQVFVIRGRTGVLSVFFSPLWLGTRQMPPNFWISERKEGRNRDLLALS